MPLHIVRNNIVSMKVDAIVNAANTGLRMGGGVCGAIFQAAGAAQLQAACNQIGGCPTGSAVLTDGFCLPAKYVIHAVGPVWQDGHHNEQQLLVSAYRRSLELAAEHRCESVAFPLISSGIYGYPKDQALDVAVATIRDFLLEQGEEELEVYLVVFDRQSFRLSRNLSEKVESFIDQHYVDQHLDSKRSRRRLSEAEFWRNEPAAIAPVPMAEESAALSSQPEKEDRFESLLQIFKPREPDKAATEVDFDRYIRRRLEETFSEKLLRLIDERGRTDVQVYRRANIDRKHFSKIRSNPAYQPKKQTVLAFAVALELDLEETRDLLRSAGYALSHSSKFDLIVECFIRNRNYDTFQLNEVLFAYDQPLLG